MPRTYAYKVKADTRNIAATHLKALSSSLFSVGSTLKSAGSRAGQGILQAVSASYEQLTTDTTDRERITFATFSQLQLNERTGPLSRPVLLLGYQNGFQLWDVQDSEDVQELLSRRDGPVSFMEPLPITPETQSPSSPFHDAWPILAVAFMPSDNNSTAITNDATSAQHCIQLYSMRSHSYVHTLTFKSRILSLKCSSRLIVVALDAQVHAYDTLTLQHTFSAVTYSVSAALSTWSSENTSVNLSAPMALGSAWLAYASNQGVQHLTAQATRLASDNPGIPNGHSNGSYDILSQYARTHAQQGAQHLKVLGGAGMKYLSGAVQIWRAGASPDNTSQPHGSSGQGSQDTEVVGTVMVRDVINRRLIAHFRAHTSPLLALRFNPSGTLLVTASLHGHNIHIFHICPRPVSPDKPASARPMASAVHLFRLSRGVTPAIIEDISFSQSSAWLAVSSARGTTHLFRLSEQDDKPPHLAAIREPSEGSPGPSAPADGSHLRHEPIKLAPLGRVRSGGILGGNVPGSAAAAAVVNLYSGPCGSCTHKVGQHSHCAQKDTYTLCSTSRRQDSPHTIQASRPKDSRAVLHQTSLIVSWVTCDQASAHDAGMNIAAAFRPAVHSTAQAGLKQGPSMQQGLTEDLCIMSAAGGLVRHRLTLQQHVQPEADPLRPIMSSRDVSKALTWTLLAEPQEKWDLCRHTSWPEREEQMQSMGPAQEEQDQTSHAEQSEPVWAMNAEVQTCSTSQAPVWADNQFSCLELQLDAQQQHSMAAESTWIEMEQVSTRRVHMGSHMSNQPSQPPTIVLSGPSLQPLSPAARANAPRLHTAGAGGYSAAPSING